MRSRRLGALLAVVLMAAAFAPPAGAHASPLPGAPACPTTAGTNDVLHQLGGVKGSDFEAVDESSLVGDPSSGAVSGAPPPVTIPGGYVLDGFGGLHPFAPAGGAGNSQCPLVADWDISRGGAL